MLHVETRHPVSPRDAKGMDTAALRASFQGAGLFQAGKIRLIYTHYDRMIVGGAVLAGGRLELDHVRECGTASILYRREMGIVNIGGDGSVSAGGTSHALSKGDVLCLPMGSGPVTFSRAGRFYITSCPAHRALPARLERLDQAKKLTPGRRKRPITGPSTSSSTPK